MKQWIYLSCALLIASLAYGDTVRLTNGDERTNVRVSRDGAKTLIYQDSSGKNVRIDAEKVKYVFYDRAPEALKKGLQAFQEQNFTKAIKELKGVKTSKFKTYADYYLGASYQKVGKFREALRSLKDVRNRDHRLTPKAHFLRGMINIYQRNYSGAQSTFGQLRSSNYSKFWNYKARYGVGLSQLYRKNYDAAKTQFISVENAAKEEKTATFALLRQLAIQGWGLALVESKVYKRAKEKFSQVIKISTNEEVLAGAYLGMGRLYYSMARDGRDAKNNYRRALFAFLRVSTLYCGLKLQYAEALHLAVRCYEQLGKDKSAKFLKQEIKVRVPKWARYRGSD